MKQIEISRVCWNSYTKNIHTKTDVLFRDSDIGKNWIIEEIQDQNVIILKSLYVKVKKNILKINTFLK